MTDNLAKYTICPSCDAHEDKIEMYTGKCRRCRMAEYYPSGVTQ